MSWQLATTVDVAILALTAIVITAFLADDSRKAARENREEAS